MYELDTTALLKHNDLAVSAGLKQIQKYGSFKSLVQVNKKATEAIIETNLQIH